MQDSPASCAPDHRPPVFCSAQGVSQARPRGALAARQAERARMALLSPARYVLASIVVATAVVWHAFSTRQQ